MQTPVIPIVIGHRGASGYRPEHTLASYQLAIDMGADFIEPDLVPTKDGFLVARHENELSTTTDVAGHSEFSERLTTKVVDGVARTGWFTEDFLLEELKSLRARERLPELRPQNCRFDGEFQIPTLQEIIDLVEANAAASDRARTVGIYPETKHPSYFASIGLALEERLLDILTVNGFKDETSPVFIQSFEEWNLMELRTMTRLRLIQLVDAVGRPYDLALSDNTRSFADLITVEGLVEVAGYADGIGVHKDLVIGATAADQLVSHAHAAGLLVHSWTHRAENYFLGNESRRGEVTDPAYLRLPGDLTGEVALFLGLGIDGFFTDYPDLGASARNTWVKSQLIA